MADKSISIRLNRGRILYINDRNQDARSLPLGYKNAQPQTTPGKEDDSMDGGGRERLEHVLEVERRGKPKPRSQSKKRDNSVTSLAI